MKFVIKKKKKSWDMKIDWFAQIYIFQEAPLNVSSLKTMQLAENQISQADNIEQELQIKLHIFSTHKIGVNRVVPLFRGFTTLVFI
jgi:hypothetical protein